MDGEVALYFPCCLCLYSILEERSPLTFAFSDIVYSQVMLEKGITLTSSVGQPDLCEEVFCLQISLMLRGPYKFFSVVALW